MPRPKVLVTGASGFIGVYVAPYLQACGYDVRAAGRGRIASGLQVTESFIAPDFRKPFDASLLVRDMDYVVHLAGIAHATASISESEYMAVNAEAAQRLASAARQEGVKRFVFVSSIRAQTGPSAPGIVTEADLPEPTDAYGRSKYAGEQMVLEELKGAVVKAAILRPVLVYGPGVKGNMATLMRAARSPWPLPVAGLRARRSLLSRVNLASAVLHALTSPAIAAGPYLVADGEALTVAEIIGALRHGLDRPPRTFAVPSKPVERALSTFGRAADIERLFGDLCVSTEALCSTGWEAAVPVRTGLAAAMRDA